MTAKKVYKGKRAAIVGLILMIAGFLFAIAETIYFGNNWLPKTHAEVVCDDIAGLISSLGGALLLYGFYCRTEQILEEHNINLW